MTNYFERKINGETVTYEVLECFICGTKIYRIVSNTGMVDFKKLKPKAHRGYASLGKTMKKLKRGAEIRTKQWIECDLCNKCKKIWKQFEDRQHKKIDKEFRIECLKDDVPEDEHWFLDKMKGDKN